MYIYLSRIYHFSCSGGFLGRNSTPRFVRPLVSRLVGWLVGRSVGPHFTFFMFLRSLPECSSNSNTAPAHPHATGVAMYPALLSFTPHHSVLVPLFQFVTICLEILL